ncbi:LysR family transcriptional regulator [Streptomyces sp. Ag109_O5-10]|uniref:LysR family transcriptional regulator n=1 Tax=Streptomyces sp. Ag109_O5-10 TaxID=1855349 RepID=UPI000895EC24|nr:LysR family transcriptional regulator [Streptomyces sp. Ag109_O5-10]SED67275.1 DNA-binding transcriptional regulator, LysR family [Streptomyces sp. Ag109_O5-10]
MLHLRYFVAVAEELNFSAAARRLHMATSPLSQRIKDLERELGKRLFDRDTHSVTLTPDGEALLPLAREVLEQFTSIPWRLREATRSGRATMFMGIPAGLHPRLREHVSELAERAEDWCELLRWPGTTKALAGGVHEGRLALALARMPVTDPALEILHVMSERLGAVVPADQFAGRDSVALAELGDLSFVVAPQEIRSAYFDQLDGEMSARGIRKRIKLTDSDYGGIAELVSSGMAFYFSILNPDNPMRGYVMENTEILPITDFKPSLNTVLIWRKDRADGGDLARLVAAAREVFADPIHL